MTETNGASRILTLDAVRGVAVMGILLMNIVAFALPQQAYFQPLAYGVESAADLWAWATAFVAIDGKMRGLFSLLFGASMLLVIESAERAGESGRRVHLIRMAWLLVFGLAHFWLIWFGDILSHYAVVGAVATLFIRKSPGALVKWAVGFFIANILLWSVIMAGAFFFEAAASQPQATAQMKREFAEMLAAFGAPGSPDIAKELVAYRGTWADAVAHRGKDGFFGPFILVAFGGMETLGLMLLGMALLKTGFLKGERDAAVYRRTMVWGYGIGLTGGVALAAFLWTRGFDTLELTTVAFTASAPFRIVTTLAHAALIVVLVRAYAGSALVDRLAAVGKAAFTNYLGTSVLMTLLFYGYGLGWFGELSRWQTYLVPPFVFMIMLLWSKPWLARYRYGPLEWLWRSLARGRIEPLRK